MEQRTIENRPPQSQMECDSCGKKMPVWVYESDLNGSYFYCEECTKPHMDKVEEYARIMAARKW